MCVRRQNFEEWRLKVSINKNNPYGNMIEIKLVYYNAEKMTFIKDKIIIFLLFYSGCFWFIEKALN